MRFHSPQLAALGIESRRAWALRAGLSPSLLSNILDGKHDLTEDTRDALAEAAGIAPGEVDDLLLSTSPEVAEAKPSGRAEGKEPKEETQGLMILCGGLGLRRRGAK